jgi:phosphoglycerate dehydrogenase-like enzyme
MATLRLHIENSSKRAALFQLTESDWAAASARHRQLANQLDVTFGCDDDVLPQVVSDIELLIGVPDDRRSLAERAHRLRWIHTTSAGMDGLLPLDWLPRGVTLTNNRGAHGVKAEQYLRMAYTLLHTRMIDIIANHRAHRWQQVFSPSIIGKTALIIGLGDLGEAAARAARQLGLNVVAVRRHAKRSRHADEIHTCDRLDDVLPRADFVVLTVPLTPETRGLLDRRRLDLMKLSASLINIARAPIVDYAALGEKLRRGELAGAILDVVEPEPLPPDSPLWDTPNLLITPHVSCDDSERYADITLDFWFANLARYAAGKPLQNRVDTRLGY